METREPEDWTVFHRETDAAKRFSEAEPEVDPARPVFTVACKNEAFIRLAAAETVGGLLGWIILTSSLGGR